MPTLVTKQAPDFTAQAVMANDAYPLKPIQTEADFRGALLLVAPYFENEP